MASGDDDSWWVLVFIMEDGRIVGSFEVYMGDDDDGWWGDDDSDEFEGSGEGPWGVEKHCLGEGWDSDDR